MKVYVQKLRPDTIIPQYKRPGDAGMDVYAAEDVTIKPGETKIVPIGISVAIPVGFEIQVRPRSGLSVNTPLRLSNSPGTIDSGYRDEIGIIITNTSKDHYHDETGKVIWNLSEYTLDEKGNKQGIYHISKGDRIAQIVLSKVADIQWSEVDDVRSIGVDRGGGFGHTGIR